MGGSAILGVVIPVEPESVVVNWLAEREVTVAEPITAP